MLVQIYIDSNIFLDLLASETVLPEHLEKMLLLCEYGAVDLFLTQQTEKEYVSNRERVIADTIKNLRKSEATGGFHCAVERHQSGTEARRLRSELSRTIREVRIDYEDAAKEGRMPVDLFFSKLKRLAVPIPNTDELTQRARQRADAHLAPGKGESLGDRLIWEALLEAGDFVEDLHLITSDSDYTSPLDPESVRKDLQDEWDERNWGKVFLYGSLSEFFLKMRENEKMIRATEVGRAIWALANLSDPPSISAASSIIQANLGRLSVRQANLVAQHAISYQTRVFISDEKFDAMLSEFWNAHSKHIDGDAKATLSQFVEANGAATYPIPVAVNGN